ncbi:MAG: rhodanese-like domain-containing protein [Tissierellia bacterium]|nr:rhodanese-like domain-containing protein [Tissierellia bacterium]
MKRISIIISLLIFLTACSGNNHPELDGRDDISSEGDYKIIKADEISDEFQLIDTRNPEFYIGWKNHDGIGGHISGAVDFPHKWFDYEKNKKYIDIELQRRYIDKNSKTILYGDESLDREIADKYKSAGFKDLYILDGGINDYASSGGDLDFLKGYSRYVSDEWLQNTIDNKAVEYPANDDYKIVEIVLKEEDYQKGHIPGAIMIHKDDINHLPGPRDLESYDNIPLKDQVDIWNLPDDMTIKKVLEESGIKEDTTVILYGSYEATTAANRAALVMDYAGVEDIRLLNGGKKLWELNGRNLDTNEEKPKKVIYGKEIPANPGIIVDYEQELNLIEDPNAIIASVRSWDEYLCKKSGYTYIAESGDIKNSRFAYAGSDPYAMEDYRNIDNTMFNYKIIKDRWEKWGINADKFISFHCGTGWRASETYYIAEAMGFEKIGLYDGGWFQWTKYPGSPVKDKGLPEDAPEDSPEEFFY